MKNISYISELNLPSTSAYSIHVMKMCNAFSKAKFKVKLFVYKKKSSNPFKFYNCTNKFKIISVNIKPDNFFLRILYGIKIFFLLFKKNDIIISRSIISAILLVILGKEVILELHHELKNFSKFFFYFIYVSFFKKKIKIIYISNALSKKYNLKLKHSIVLDDAVDLNDFNFNKKNIKKINNACVYCGSFAKGKGIEKIIEIAKITKKINYHLYGDLINSSVTLKELNEIKNISYKGFIEYRDIPRVLAKYQVLMLPYSTKVYVRSNNIEVGKFMSPMKMFDYLASGKIIVATNLPVYRHILNKENSVLISKNAKPMTWAKKIGTIFKYEKKFKSLRIKAYNTAKEYTWDLRVKKIIDFKNS